ncbi:uncharacterized protein L969DRAFT_86512 [Mixia osmundae IAM 14324]|uniref:Anaphase-promoting complex subunit 4 WD40 domain-containing protein n=1 Tax=Mixia osmundae (strain CBS 9802 / IAM 14324 / JCM 22182 / KY 12970) TaxID=764103 RepID=G7E9G5_MIXOS|nr:uncharacterized protein L969DRAFT_86512 [Mixia osmundae IAM 14324]KEI39917.1 hypothetical protein L969DRAFT_86512 [Mixia osmundae IAM 14324]GAA99284.1 hypothetical protein E5Q_05979 [Mixia osmundae IAM 14324]
MASKTASTSSLTLDAAVWNKFRPSKLHRNIVSGKSFTSLCFDDHGDHLITSSDDETMQLYDCRTGTHTKPFLSQKYGVHLARFTHKSTTVIHASTKQDDTIRYLSLHDNTYLRYFRGHKKRVTSLEMSPKEDIFLSGSDDDTVRLWDLRTNHCQGALTIAGKPNVAWDPKGEVFAVALNMRASILLYDRKKFDADPFLTIEINDPILHRSSPVPVKPILTSAHFSNDGEYILVGTSGTTHYIHNSFSGQMLARLEGHTGLEGFGATHPDSPPRVGISGCEVGWSPDAKFVVSGSANGNIYVWDIQAANLQESQDDPNVDFGGNIARKGTERTLQPCAVLQGYPTNGSSLSATRCVAFNPRKAMLASANDALTFWLPERERDLNAIMQ